MRSRVRLRKVHASPYSATRRVPPLHRRFATFSLPSSLIPTPSGLRYEFPSIIRHSNFSDAGKYARMIRCYAFNQGETMQLRLIPGRAGARALGLALLWLSANAFAASDAET